MSSIISRTLTRTLICVPHTHTHTHTHTQSAFSGVDTDVVTEVHGLIGELLMNESFSDGTGHTLKKIKELLAPKANKNVQFGPRITVGMEGCAYIMKNDCYFTWHPPRVR